MKKQLHTEMMFFLYICAKLEEHGYREKGLAFRIMDQTRKGYYYRNGMDRLSRNLLLGIGVSEQYIACLEKTAYLFPKAQGIVQVRFRPEVVIIDLADDEALVAMARCTGAWTSGGCS